MGIYIFLLFFSLWPAQACLSAINANNTTLHLHHSHTRKYCAINSTIITILFYHHNWYRNEADFFCVFLFVHRTRLTFIFMWTMLMFAQWIRPFGLIDTHTHSHMQYCPSGKQCVMAWLMRQRVEGQTQSTPMQRKKHIYRTVASASNGKYLPWSHFSYRRCI